MGLSEEWSRLLMRLTLFVRRLTRKMGTTHIKIIYIRLFFPPTNSTAKITLNASKKNPSNTLQLISYTLSISHTRRLFRRHLKGNRTLLRTRRTRL